MRSAKWRMENPVGLWRVFEIGVDAHVVAWAFASEWEKIECAIPFFVVFIVKLPCAPCCAFCVFAPKRRPTGIFELLGVVSIQHVNRTNLLKLKCGTGVNMIIASTTATALLYSFLGWQEGREDG